MTRAPSGSRLRRWARHWGLGAILLVAAVVYGASLGSYRMLMWDEAEYATLARAVARGDGFVGYNGPERLRPPLLPLAGAVAIGLRGTADDRAVGWATVALALLALSVVYAAAAIAYDAATGVLAAGLLATAPWFWGATANFLSEIPLLAWFAAALFCWHFGLERESRWFYGAWLCAGLALLTRYTALLLLPLFLLLTLAAATTAGARRLDRHFLLAPLLGLLAVAPWLLRQALLFGDPMIGVWRAGGQLQSYMPGVSMPATFYLTQLPAMLSVPFAMLLVAGVLWALWRGDRLALDCVLVVLFILGWFGWYRYKEQRLITAMLPACAVLGAAFVTRGLLGGRRMPPLAALALVALLGLANAPGMRHRFATVHTLGAPSLVEAMAFVRAHSPDDARLIGASAPQIRWYADRAVQSFPPREQLSALLAAADWVVITNFERGQPDYVAELAAAIPPAAFADGSAHRFDDQHGYRTIVVRPAVFHR
ncbi:MAG: glycosyltransferase family 39 protein [Deltaproteobacteria bacterium]|nr:glycosyltransferase family 39 protein [Deltaproteobacteria bacterium]